MGVGVGEREREGGGEREEREGGSDRERERERESERERERERGREREIECISEDDFRHVHVAMCLFARNYTSVTSNLTLNYLYSHYRTTRLKTGQN